MSRQKLTAVLAAALAVLVPVVAAGASTRPATTTQAPSPFEVWTVDQSNSAGKTFGGVLHVFDGMDLTENAADAQPESVDLAGETSDLCLQETGARPVRPHMLVFDAADRYAALAFVVSGHVVFFDAAERKPLACLRTSAGAGGARQAHAVWPSPDQRFMYVANQNGKRFERIRTDYENETFEFEPEAMLDLANCVTPSGAPCQSAELRPDNAPICPRTDDSGKLTFITLRGGGMFVVDGTATPMKIVAEYDKDTVHPAGCGGIEAGGKMYVNSGGPHHDVYAFRLAAFARTNGAPQPNQPAPRLVYSRDSEAGADSHGVAIDRDGRHLWVADRLLNDVTVVDTRNDRVVNAFSLAGGLSDDPSPDLLGLSPSGEHMFASLRGTTALSGGHEAKGSTPGVGVIEVRDDGRDGELVSIAPLPGADPHALRVRTVPPATGTAP